MIQILKELLTPNDYNILLLLFSSYRVSIDGKKIIPIEIGLPQGGILSPLLFLIFINKLLEKIQKNLPRSVIDIDYADDICLYANCTNTLYQTIKTIE